ncbi:hypothetical protein QUA83_23385 [Microcoleus sp. K1-B1]|uniref:hypothetical protein n=1 Tax=Microcoleus sp. K1-B6 TaxID=2818787 RepID=UPI002FD7A35F
MSNQATTIPSVDLAMVPGTVYLQDCVSNQLSKLYTLDLATGKATLIGSLGFVVKSVSKSTKVWQ